MEEPDDLDATVPPARAPRARTRRPRTRIGRYRVIELIGSGGNGEVYKVDADDGLGPKALKVMTSDWGVEGDAEGRFVREARILSEADHPHIVRFHGNDFDEDPKFYVMELLEGSLWPPDRSRMPPEQAIDAVLQALEALAYAHARGIVHRDVKPANLLRDKAGRIKLADFGVAYVAEGRTHTRVVGTSGFTAPELELEQPRVTPRADLYSAGVTILALVTAQVPVTYLWSQALRQVPFPLRVVVRRATARDPERRYASAEEMAHALRRAAWCLRAITRLKALRVPIGAAATLALVAGAAVLHPRAVDVPTAEPPAVADATALPSPAPDPSEKPAAPQPAPVLSPPDPSPPPTAASNPGTAPVAARPLAERSPRPTAPRTTPTEPPAAPPQTNTQLVPTTAPPEASAEGAGEFVYVFVRTASAARIRLNGVPEEAPLMRNLAPGTYRLLLEEAREPHRRKEVDLVVKPGEPIHRCFSFDEKPC